MTIGKRAATQEDYSWLFELKTASMKEYVDEVYGWNDADQESYFNRDFFPDQITIVTVDEQDAGMFVLDKGEDMYFLRRIEIHPSFQNQGVGSRVIQEILDQAASAEVPVRLMVF